MIRANELCFSIHCQVTLPLDPIIMIIGRMSLCRLCGTSAFHAGLVGHTGFNALLRFFPPLVITMAIPLESIIGSMLGWVFGVSDIPGVWTWVGGLVMV